MPFGISEGDLHAYEFRICGGNGVVAIQTRDASFNSPQLQLVSSGFSKS